MKDLSVVSESIQRIYSLYLEKQLIVNRRYQRKLVWTIDEKASFIDSIMRSYPVPLILLAESQNDSNIAFEIIDGMQRLNAVMSFIENEFPVEGKYFDLETMAETKLLKDNNVLVQQEPKLDRKKCAEFTGYVLPMSTYRGASSEEIDEVFRRINANGRHLSRQEIRQAGALYPFADLVRKIACEIRGDASLTDKIELNKMPTISITSRELKYGINVDEVFWVQNSIIRREQVRESKDEEIIADIIATMLFDEMQGSSSNILDEYYCLKASTKRSDELNRKIAVMTPEKVHENFFKVYDLLKTLLKISGKSFNALISRDRSFDKVPRYFEIVFLALYNLIVKENKKISSQYELIKSLDDITSSISLSQGGGNWSAQERETSINGVVGIINKNFVDNEDDPAVVLWSTQLETILRQSKTEQTSFDFKVSFYDFREKVFNDKVLDKALRTLTAMANRGKGSIGYVVFGVADKKSDADVLESIDSKYKAIEFNGFYITGLNFDIDIYNHGEDRFYQNIVQKITQSSLDYEYQKYILNNIKFLSYGEKMVLILSIMGLDTPAIYNGEYYQRIGANIEKVETKDFISLMKKFS